METKTEVITVPSYFLPTIYEVVRRDLHKWACDGLATLKGLIAQVPVDDYQSYSSSFEALRKTWYNFLHDRLHEFDFINGEPKENTWDLRPKACFWWEVFKIEPMYYRPYYEHSCSSKERQEQMFNLLNDLISALEEPK